MPLTEMEVAALYTAVYGVPQAISNFTKTIDPVATESATVGGEVFYAQAADIPRLKALFGLTGDATIAACNELIAQINTAKTILGV